jgi:hypothetical protein
MNFVKLLLDENYGNYSYTHASNTEMGILGLFLTDDASYHPESFKQFALNTWEESTSSNATALEKDNGYILLRDLYPEEKIPTILKMSQDQFIKVLTDWEEKVLKTKPKEIIITYENDKFVFETKN